MCYREGGPTCHKGCLGCYAAGPEDGDLALVDGDWVAEIGFMDVLDSDKPGISYVDRGTMDGGETTGGKDRSGNHGGRDGPHADDCGAGEAPRRLAGDVGDVHRNVTAAVDVSDGDGGFDEGPFKAEGAAQEEPDKVVLPVGADVRRFIDAFPVLPDAVAGNVGSQVGAGGHDPWFGISWLGDVEDGAGFGISLGEYEEVVGPVPGQNNQVALDMSPGHSRCGAVPVS